MTPSRYVRPVGLRANPTAVSVPAAMVSLSLA